MNIFEFMQETNDISQREETKYAVAGYAIAADDRIAHKTWKDFQKAYNDATENNLKIFRQDIPLRLRVGFVTVGYTQKEVPEHIGCFSNNEPILVPKIIYHLLPLSEYKKLQDEALKK